MNSKQLSFEVVGAAIEVHKVLGPGMLESAYQECLAFELESRGIHVSREVLLPIMYKAHKVNKAYRLDLLVENTIIIETKTVEELTDVHLAQIITYLKFGGKSLGYLMNFRVSKMIDGIRRVIL
jgi:GxxExxY protein